MSGSQLLLLQDLMEIEPPPKFLLLQPLMPTMPYHLLPLAKEEVIIVATTNVKHLALSHSIPACLAVGVGLGEVAGHSS